MVSLDPVRGSERASTRPALILQNDAINRFTTTVMALRPASPTPPCSASLPAVSQQPFQRG